MVMHGGGIRGVGEPRRYRIVLAGELSERFADRFEGMTLESGGGKTFLWGEIADQSQLHGILDRVEDLGLELLSVTEAARPPSPEEPEESRKEGK